MALTATFRSSCHSTSGATSYATTAAFTPAANSLIVAFIYNRVDGTAPTAVQTTGATNRYTFSSIASYSTANVRLELWAADSGATPPNDTITASGWSTARTGCDITVIEVTGADLSAGVDAAFVQHPTNNGTSVIGTYVATNTLASAADSNNRPISTWAVNENVTKAPRTNWTELDDGGYDTPGTSLETQWRSDAFETSCDATWTAATAVVWSSIAAEIKAVANATACIINTTPVG